MALQTLNIGTVANDGTGDALRSAMDKVNDNFLLISNPNLIINPDFSIWQKENQLPFSSDGYTADRWALALSGATATVDRSTFTIGQTSVPNNPRYYLSLDVTTGDNNVNISQKVEGVERTAGEELTLSFWAKGTNPGGGSIEFIWFQNFGTGGSSAVSNVEDTYTLTGSWQKFTTTFTPTSISGKTIGTGNDDRLQITLRQPSGDSSTDAWSLDLANVKLEFGNTATSFERPNPEEELSKCKRYFFNLLGEGDNTTIGNGTADTTTRVRVPFTFSNSMRAAPAISASATTGDFQIFSSSGIDSGLEDAIGISKSGATLRFTRNSGSHSAGDSFFARTSTSTTGYIYFDAEL